MSETLPSTFGALGAIVQLTLRRLVRGRSVWLAIGFAALPVVYATFSRGKNRNSDELLGLVMMVASVVQPLLVASSIGEEIEDRTTTYLWSRPLPRWTVLVGKLVALAPIGAAIAVASAATCVTIEYDRTIPAAGALAIAAGGLAMGAISAGVATLVPKHGMPLAIVYLGMDFVIGNIPWSLQVISATHQTTMLARGDGAPAAIALAIIAAVWLALGLVRVRRLEA